MLNHEIKQMRTTIAGMLLRKVPPKTVAISAEQAYYLGFKVEPERLEALEETTPDGFRRASITRVKVEDLYVKLKGAKGSDGDEPTGKVFGIDSNRVTIQGANPGAEAGQAGDQDSDSGEGNQPAPDYQARQARAE